MPLNSLIISSVYKIDLMIKFYFQISSLKKPTGKGLGAPRNPSFSAKNGGLQNDCKHPPPQKARVWTFSAPGPPHHLEEKRVIIKIA